MNLTHDPAATSWLAAANEPDTDFPIQNLPFGRFCRRGDGGAGRLGVAIGDAILPLDAVGEMARSLKEVMRRSRAEQSALRRSLFEALQAGAPPAIQARLRDALVPMRDADLLLPCQIGDFTDFFASIHHATNAAALMRPGAPLFPNYRHMPLAYHGRASSVVVSGTPIRRPHGQQRRREGLPVFAPTRRLDFEAELGWIVGRDSALGEPVAIDRAWDHLFGVCLLNDWSARDIQAWESDPLGPFLGKSFATTISPWIITAEALEPFRAAAPPRTDVDPPLAEYLSSARDREAGAVRIAIDIIINGTRVAAVSAAGQYWSVAQLVAHQTSNGCNLRAGDLLGSGTLSGPTPESLGCLLELTGGGRQPIALDDGTTRAFLEDGDEVVFRGRCSAPGARTIGFGECRGVVTAPART
ncbi:MAG: fumarylacetoacetase [Vicinamibacterales bacterium]